MGLEVKLEPELGGLEVKLELAGGVEAKLEWDGLQIKVEVMDHPEEMVEVKTEGLEVKQELIDGVEVKQELIDGVEVKQELIDGVEVKQEVIDGVQVKQEVIDEVHVKQELIDEINVKQELLDEEQVLIDGVHVKQELIDEVTVKQELIDGVNIKQELIDEVQVKQELVDGEQELMDRVEVKQEFMDEPEVKQEFIDGGKVKEEFIDRVYVKEEFIDGIEVKKEFIDKLDVKEEFLGGLVGNRWKMKEWMFDWLEGQQMGIPVGNKMEVKEELMGGEMKTNEVIGERRVKEEMPDEVRVKEEEMMGEAEMKEEEVMGKAEVKEMLDELKMKDEMMDGMQIKEDQEQIIVGVHVKEEVMGGMEEEKMMESRMEEKEEAIKVKMKTEVEVKTEVKKENGMEVKIEMDMEKEEVKEEEMDGALVREDGTELTEEQEPHREPRVGSKRKLAMSSCETCGMEEAKYRCPRCMKCSCSLACVKKHKTELTCSGIREKTAFVSLKQFTEINLLSDYRFLEDIGRSADYIARDIFLKRPSTNRILNYMKNRARRHNIDLRILPIGFTKRRENSTMFDRKEQRFYWHLKLLFPQSHAEYVEKGVPGDKKLHEILRNYIDPEKSDPVIRQRLKVYVFSETGVQILMKIENMQHNLVRYYELDPCKSLIDNLKDKVVIEYPTLHVILKGSKNDMVILGQERNESTENFGSENPALSSEEEGEIQESS
ncbi:box C/D snoRNA protein 1 isoform X1 [Gracilinanus agilis]|uniref:box C/D snoRNA protein 1 isoform X1 n=1 Tax=Gracilinanus agilis TaxID=191870 RepID=UPI001CFE9A0C|nr:box C/D snoRNA protein 1 isoform X1 [Gracilinanus agilis]